MIRLSLLTTLLVAALSAAAANSASAVTKGQCETIATNCLGICAGFDLSTAEGNTQYGKCVNRCDGRRGSCLMEAESNRSLTVAPDEPTKPGLNLIVPGIEPARSPSDAP